MKEYAMDGDRDLHVVDPSNGGDRTPESLPTRHEKGTPEVRIIRKRLRGSGKTRPGCPPPDDNRRQ